MTTTVVQPSPPTVPAGPARRMREGWPVFALVVLVAATIGNAAIVLPGGSSLNHVSGTWTVLAQDLVHGTFYRPLLGPEGYGGTRYMPLFFVIHAGLAAASGRLVPAGHVLSAAAILALAAAAYRLLRALAVRRDLAIAAAVLLLASAAVQTALTSIRGDGLPAALNLWGAALLVARFGGDGEVRSQRSMGRLALPSLVFALAFLAKLTALWAPAAMALWLALRPGGRAAAVRLLVLTAIGMAVGLLTVQWASDGRFLDSMLACASSEGLHASGLVHMVRRALTADPVGAFVVVLAGALAASAPGLLRPIAAPLVLFLSAAAATAALSLSPGTDWNHLIDLDVAAIVLLAWLLHHGIAPRGSAKAILAAVALLGAAHIATIGTPGLHRGPDPSRGAAVEAARRWAASGHAVLIENSSIALEAGGRPFVLDPFALRLVRQTSPEIDRDFRSRLEDGFWPAVVLMKDPEGDDASWYEAWHFGAGFREALLSGYQRSDARPGAIVYVARARS